MRRPFLSAPLALLVLAGCSSAIADLVPDAGPIVGRMRIAPEGRPAETWGVTEARMHAAGEGGTRASLSLGGPEGPKGSDFNWHLYAPLPIAAPAVGTYALEPYRAHTDLLAAAEFSGGVMRGGECGTPSWSYGAAGGTVTITSVAGGVATGTYTATLGAPDNGPYGRRVTVSGTFAAPVE